MFNYFSKKKVAGLFLGLFVTLGLVFGSIQAVGAAKIKVADIINLFITLGIIDNSKVTQAKALAASLGDLTIELAAAPAKVSSSTIVYFSRDLTVGSKGNDVSILQQIIGVTVTGTFDSETKQGVMVFQKNSGITPVSGYVGTKTRASLNVIASKIFAAINSTKVASTTSATVSQFNSNYQNSGSQWTNSYQNPSNGNGQYYYYYNNSTADNTGTTNATNTTTIDDSYIRNLVSSMLNYSNTTTNSSVVETVGTSTSTASSTSSVITSASTTNPTFNTDDAEARLRELASSMLNYSNSTDLSSSSDEEIASGEEDTATTSTSTPWKVVEKKGETGYFSFGGKVTKILPCLINLGFFYVEYESYSVSTRKVAASSTDEENSESDSTSDKSSDESTDDSTASSSMKTEKKTNGTGKGSFISFIPPKKGSFVVGKTVPIILNCATCLVSGKLGCLVQGRRALYWNSNAGLSFGL